MVTALNFQCRGPMFKPTGWLQGRLVFHPSEIDRNSTSDEGRRYFQLLTKIRFEIKYLRVD